MIQPQRGAMLQEATSTTYDIHNTCLPQASSVQIPIFSLCSQVI
jgi:hypothetical protein